MSLKRFKRMSLGEKHELTNDELKKETEKLKTDKVETKTKKKI